MKKRILSVVLALCMVFSMIPIYVSADDVDTSEIVKAEWEYEMYGDGVALTAYNGTASDVYVPSTIHIGETEYAVLKLADSIFENNDSLNSVTLGAGILEIGNRAFYDCDNMVCILLAYETATIGDEAFYSCDAFNSIILYDTVTTIGADAFAKCPKLVIWCNEGTVGYAYALENNIPYEILNPDAEPEVFSQGGITYYALNGEANAVGYDSAVADVVIPAEVDGYPVTSVKDIFNNSTTLKSIEINALITEINSNKFSGCSNLVSVKLPNSIKAIGASAFKGCGSLKNIVLPSGITSIGGEAFYGCNALTEITIPNGVKVIPESCFNDCRNLVTVNLPEGLTSIYERAFWFCRNLKNIEIPSTVRTIDDCAFYDCSSITDITIPDGITVLGFSSFEGCSSLKNVVIPNSVTKLEGDNFRDCTSLETVTLPGNMDTWRLEFFGCSSLKTVIISEGSTSVKDYGFEESVTEIILPSTLKEIQSNAFSSCTNLTNIVIPEGVQTIGAGAFSGCLKMKNVVIPKSVTNIRADSFHSATIWLVYENSYAHTFAENNDLLYFVMRKTENPEINYGARISGTVTYTDGSIASDVAVEIIYDDGVCKETVKTDLNGAYEFTYAEVGRYTIRVVDSNNNTASSAVSVKRMNVFDVFVAGDTDLTLKRGYTVSGTVNEANANVTITDKDGNVIDSVISDRNGYFLISNIPNGEYILKAETENGSVTTEITVFNAEIGGLELIIVTETASLWGYVEIEDRSENHHRRSWVQITVYNQDGIAVDQCKTDKDGKYNFKNLPLGEYVIVAETSEMRPDKEHGYDRNYNLTGYAYINITEAREYKVETIVLYEESESKADIIGKVTAKGSPQISIVTLTNVFGDEIDSVTTGKNGKFVFKNVSDGMYFIWAVTENDGSGFAVVVVRKGKIYGDTKIKVEKNSSIKEHEDNFKSEFDNIRDKESAILHKERIAQEKRYYDSLSQKEKKQLSKYYIDKINELSQWIAACEYNTIGDVTVEGGLVVSGNEIENEEQIAFTINVTKTNAPSVSTDGVKNKEDFNNHSIKDKAGKKEIKQYYEITMTKTTADGDKAITSVYKDTDSNSKFRITLTIPEEYRGYKNYSFVHEHHGEVITLCDLDNDPNTVTFEVDKFSTFVLTATNEEQGEDVLSGDLDLDGKTSATDLSMLKKVLLGTDNGKSPILNDVNDDNKTDICDLVRLKKGLSGT